MRATPFKFPLTARVLITCSGEAGQVISRAEHLNAEPNYFVRYKAADGRATEKWWPESSLTWAGDQPDEERAPEASTTAQA